MPRRVRLRVLVSAMVAGDPGQGGASWAALQYAVGLQRLGHEIMLVEPVAQLSPTVVNYFQRVVREFGLDRCAALVSTGTRQTAGAPYHRLVEFARRADVLLNLSGMLADARLVDRIPRRVYLDLDPGFNQLWHAAAGIDRGFDRHTHFATVGLALGAADCRVPTCGVSWITTPPPVVLEHWPHGDALRHDAFTTVGNWRGYGSIEHAGVHYGQRAHSFRRFMALPSLTSERFAPALAIHPDERADLASLAANGWERLEPAAVAGTPSDYRSFVRGSRAELGIAKSGYVAGQTGWFSDRSACYLAAGRPVLIQDTGLYGRLPLGEGLLTYRTLDELLAGVEELRRNYEHHRRAARSIAEQLLDSDRVLSHLIDAIC